ncbi:MAG: hypothetical protein ACKO34_06065 [Vampirovibrionales bacterium]
MTLSFRNLLILFLASLAISLAVLILFFVLFFQNMDVNLNIKKLDTAPLVQTTDATSSSSSAKQSTLGPVSNAVALPPFEGRLNLMVPSDNEQLRKKESSAMAKEGQWVGSGLGKGNEPTNTEAPTPEGSPLATREAKRRLALPLTEQGKERSNLLTDAPAPPTPVLRRYKVSLGGFRGTTEAKEVVQELQGRGLSGTMELADDGTISINVGEYTSLEQAQRIANQSGGGVSSLD